MNDRVALRQLDEDSIIAGFGWRSTNGGIQTCPENHPPSSSHGGLRSRSDKVGRERQTSGSSGSSTGWGNQSSSNYSRESSERHLTITEAFRYIWCRIRQGPHQCGRNPKPTDIEDPQIQAIREVRFKVEESQRTVKQLERHWLELGLLEDNR